MERWKFRFNKFLLPVIFGLVIIGLAVYGIYNDTQKEYYKRQLVGFYEKSFEDMVTDIGSLETKLGKLQASNSDGMFSLLLADVWRQTGDTESSIASLPISAVQAQPFTQFINRLGDYCRYLDKKIARGEKLTDEDFAQMQGLKKTCAELNNRLVDVANKGFVPVLEMQEAAYYAEAGSGDKEENSQTLDFTNQEYPKLQYDGPFSESTENKQPKGLTGSDIGPEQAQAAAQEFLGRGYVKALNRTDDLNGTIAAYGFDGKSEDGDFSIYITKKGSHVLYYMTNTESDVQAVPTDERYDELTKVAIQYFTSKGYPDMKPSYAQFYNGLAVINLAPVEQDIVLYPDLVKAWVDIERNRVVGIDTTNYLMSHLQRNYPAVKISKEDAQKKLTSRLKVESTRMALIPTEQLKEVLCWEFKGKIDDTDYFVYINVETGMEEDVLQIQHTNEGTLVM